VPDDEQAVANGTVIPTTVEEMPTTLSAPIRLSFASAPADPGPGPGLGQHTDEVLGELGYGAAEIARLRATGALG
jgi:crotonobetainyl-CoA:carnitine CoA-transferase CaiB-like acyl-CoA transferase